MIFMNMFDDLELDRTDSEEILANNARDVIPWCWCLIGPTLKGLGIMILKVIPETDGITLLHLRAVRTPCLLSR